MILIQASILLNITIVMQNVTLQQEPVLLPQGAANTDTAMTGTIPPFDKTVDTTYDFEKEWCGWTDVSKSNIQWERTNKLSESTITGPSRGDHTFDHTTDKSGYYLYVNMNAKNSQILNTAVLRSPTYTPLPFNKSSSNDSCKLRFFYHMFGPHVGSLQANLIELKPGFPRSVRLVTISRDHGNLWYEVTRPIPQIEYKYYIEFVATRGARSQGDIAIDDISLSPECVEHATRQDQAQPVMTNQDPLCKDVLAIKAFYDKVEWPNDIQNITDFCSRSVPPTSSEVMEYLTSEKGQQDNKQFIAVLRDCKQVRPEFERLSGNSELSGLGYPITSAQKQAILQALGEALPICDQQKQGTITDEAEMELIRLLLRSVTAALPEST